MVCSEVGGTYTEAKELCIAVLNGQKLTDEQEEIAILKELSVEGRLLRWASVALDREFHTQLLDEADGQEATSFFYVWTGVEAWVLEAMTSVVASTMRPAHLSLHCDGFMVDEPCARAHPELLEKCVEEARRVTGY